MNFKIVAAALIFASVCRASLKAQDNSHVHETSDGLRILKNKIWQTNFKNGKN